MSYDRKCLSPEGLRAAQSDAEQDARAENDSPASSYTCDVCRDEDEKCQECCPHDDQDNHCCLICDKDMGEENMSRAYDAAKDARKYGD